MKGVVLAGGLGTRLRPLTDVVNKHLLPVYNQPMVYYPIQCLRNAGIDEVMIVTGGAHAGAFFNVLRNGEAFDLRRIAYAYQNGEGGIADALALAEEFVDGDEHTLDVYTDLEGMPRCVVPRKRLEVRSGEVSKGITVKNTAIMEIGRSVAEALGACRGLITVQCIVTSKGRIRVIEINPR